MKILRILCALAFAAVGLASAQAQNTWETPGGSRANGSVGMCLNTQGKAVPCSSATPVPISGSFTATLAGFTPNGSYANLTAGATSASVALPSGAVVAFQNAGTTTVSCTLGVGSATATASELVIPPGSSLGVTVGSNTFGACIDQTGSTSNVVALAGGTGLFTGYGAGAAGGGGGGAVNILDFGGTNEAAVNASHQLAIQAPPTLPLPAGAATAANQEVTAAGSTASNAQAVQGVTGGVPLPVTGTLSASIGAFAPGNAYAPLSVTTSTANVALPTGVDIIVYNTGTVDAYVHLGTTGVTATISQDVVKAGQAIEMAVGSNDHLAAITASGSTALTISGGAGIFAGVGGSGSSGGGGAVTIADGADVAEGAKADTAYAGSGSASVVAGIKGLYAAVTGAIPAGTAIIGKVGIDQTTPGTTNAIAAQPTPVTSGGLATYFLQPAASDNHANIKNGAGQIYHVAVTNNSATINYVRFYNAATGFNACNSATNLIYQLAIPASTSGAGFVQDISMGIAFSTGISICVTSGYATTDTTSATASAMSVMVGYK